MRIADIRYMYELTCNNMCFSLKPVESRFLTEYVATVRPLAKTLDILQQGSNNTYMGYFLPTLYLLQEKLRAKRQTAQVRVNELVLARNRATCDIL